jgi:hypothetical protein
MSQDYFEYYDRVFDAFKIKIGLPKYIAFADGYCEFYNGEGSKLNVDGRDGHVQHCTDISEVKRILETWSKVIQERGGVRWYTLYNDFGELYNNQPKFQQYLNVLKYLSKNFSGNVQQYLQTGFECVEGELVQYRVLVHTKTYVAERYQGEKS